jgi:hypothetical protein
MIVEVCYDSDGLYIPIPEELMDRMGWEEGDLIRWEKDLVGYALTKVEEVDEDEEDEIRFGDGHYSTIRVS